MGQITSDSKVFLINDPTELAATAGALGGMTLEYNELGKIDGARAAGADNLDISFTSITSSDAKTAGTIGNTLTLVAQNFGHSTLTNFQNSALAGRIAVLESIIDSPQFTSTNTVAKYIAMIINGADSGTGWVAG